MDAVKPRSAANARMLLEHLAESGTPPPGAASLIDVGSGDFLAYFDAEILDGLAARGGSTCRFFEGAYGAGKTHLLQLLEDQARGRGMGVVKVDLSQALSLSDWRLITLYILQNIEFGIGGETVRGLPRILSALGSKDMADTKALELASLPHPGFKAAMLRMARNQDTAAAAAGLMERYLLGERIGALALRGQGIHGVKNPLSVRNAEQVLNTVLGGLFRLGSAGTLLMFDENERTLGASNRFSIRVSLAANLMRRFIDQCFTGGLVGTVAVFAVLPNFVGTASTVYPALGQRLRTSQLDGFNPSWRWPVLSTQEVSSIRSPEDFLAAATTRILELGGHDGKEARQLESKMMSAGTSILNSNAGTGYRREIVKALATLAVRR